VGGRREYQGKTVVITGAAGGLGRAFAGRFGFAGAKLFLLDLDAKSVYALAEELESDGRDCLGMAVDVTDPAACQEAVNLIDDRFGGVDVLINNAGISHRSLFAQTSLATIRQVMEVNFFGAVNCTRAALDSLIRRKGQIIVISTVAGFAPLIGRTGYSASKHALHGFFDTLRAELTRAGVTVTIACPGFTRTGLAHSALGGDGQPVRQTKVTVGRESTPEEAAEGIFRAVEREKRLVVLTSVGKLSRVVSKFWPSLYERLMTRSIGAEFER